MQNHIPILLCVALLLPASVESSPVENSSGEDGAWVIEQDTVLEGGEKVLRGDVTVRNNATLVLHHAHLRVGGRLLVEEGSTLVLASAAGSSISSTGEGFFWIHVQGSMRTEGGDHMISGLGGEGLSSAYQDGIGGLRVDGEAYLRNTVIQEGSGGIIIGEDGTVEIHNSRLSGLGYFGVAALGTLRLENSTVQDVRTAILAREPCHVTITNTTLAADVENTIINGCQASIADSVLYGSMVSLTANNKAVLDVRSTRIEDYTIDGLGSYAFPEDGRMHRPTVRLHDTVFDPAPEGQRAADLEGLLLAEFHNVTIRGHQENGIRAASSVLSLKDSVITENARWGVKLTGGRLTSDPTQGNEWEERESGTANGEGPLSHTRLLDVRVKDSHGNDIPGDHSLALRQSASGEEVPVHVLQRHEEGGLRVAFEAFGSEKGRPLQLGPFEYVFSSDGLPEQRGPLAENASTLELLVQMPAASGGVFPAAPAAALLFAAGLGFFGFGLYGRRKKP